MFQGTWYIAKKVTLKKKLIFLWPVTLRNALQDRNGAAGEGDGGAEEENGNYWCPEEQYTRLFLVVLGIFQGHLLAIISETLFEL